MHVKYKYRVLALGAFGSSLLAAHGARAQQTDVNPPLPNVMLLLDSSGSMEMMADGTDPDANAASKCTIGTSSLANRWGTAVQALTGEISGPSGAKYSCVTQARTGIAFQNEYGIAGVKPYDYDYSLGFHRPASGTCVVTPGKLPGLSVANGGAGGFATDFNALTSIVTRDYNTGTTGCAFTQVSDGALDSARDILRFGLMTFDSDPAAGTGVTTGANPVVNTLAPFAGMWSYFPGWNTGTASAFTGHPINCLTDSLYEVGAKNPAAPPWEGRLMGLPADPNATIAQIEQANDSIQLVINAMRPYGATPTSAMLQDLKNYYWADSTGPQANDPYVSGNCRDEYAILLTDGAPNLDLRPYCTPEGPNPAGHCPYALPEDIAAQLYAGNDGKISGHRIITYVVGFNVNTINDAAFQTPVDCGTLAADQTAFNATCAAQPDLYGSCCSLEKVAYSGSGGTQPAFFVKTQDDLLNALNVIISKIAKNTTARTVPSYSPSVATVNNDPNSPITNGSVYLASFQPLVGQTWSGDVTRQRYVCDALQNLTQPTPDPTQGDDFSKDLNNGAGGPYGARQFSVIQPAATSGTYTLDALATIRPFAANSDGLGTYGGTILPPTDATTAMTLLTADALQINDHSCANLTNTEFLTADSCKKLAINFAVGSATTDAMPDATFTAFKSRVGNAFGDIFHATPTVIGPPNAVIRDSTYEAFAATYAKRPTVLYAATNDGLLHAFNTGVAAQQNNEMWAMFPPAVLPKLLSVYPAGHALMLDGAPVVKDVVWDRTAAQIGDATKWHTMLVAGYGSGAQGYYAIDITDPDQRTPVVGGGTPQFRWQLTKMPTGTKQIFGQHSATPAITTVFADLGDGSGAHEIGVAILPGGQDGSPTTTTACNRDSDTADSPLSTNSLASPPNSAFPARAQVQCWSSNGRSLSVVRLDTGEIIRTFMRTADAPAAVVSANKLRPTPLDSPMTGVPVVYPTDVGAIAQRAYVGDADGTMWRFDLTSQNPDLWSGQLFVDAYNTDPNVITPNPYQDGQPIAVPPTVAIDDVGNVVVSFATGDQETYTASGYNFVYSVTEKLSTATSSLRANVNWFLRFINGQRVSGPMAVFDETLYFATFAAPANTAVCTLGAPTLYGRDFEVPKDSSSLQLGGLPRLNPNAVAPVPDFIDPTNGSASSPFAGKIIPGVSINITPTCSNTSTAVNDSYVPGAQHYLAQNVTSGSPSLFAQVGGQNASGQPLSVSVSLPRPATVTSVDSWAAVVE